MDELGSPSVFHTFSRSFRKPMSSDPAGTETCLPLPGLDAACVSPGLASPCAPWPDPSSCCCRLRAPMTTVAMAATAAGADALCARPQPASRGSRHEPQAPSPPTALSTLQRSASDTSRAAVGINTTPLAFAASAPSGPSLSASPPSASQRGALEGKKQRRI